VPEGEEGIPGGEVPEDQQIKAGSAGLDEKVSVDLRNIDVTDALRFLALKGGLNLAVSKSVTGRVQLLLNDIPVRDILDIILISNSLAYEKYGNVYRIMTETEYKERFGRRFSDSRKVKLFKIRYAIPDQVFSLFEVLKSEIGRLLVDPESGTVLVMDTQENIDKMTEALASLEQKKTLKVYALKYAKALDVETRLKMRLDSKKVGSAVADERTNSVTVETLPDRIAETDEVVESLDQKTKEVLIDAKIIKVTLTDNLDAEIQWEGMFTSMWKYGSRFIGNHGLSPVFRNNQTFIEDFTTIAPTANPTAGGKNVLTENLFIGNVDQGKAFEVMINFLKTLGDTKILSNPKIAAINNQEAKIHVGEKQAYVTTTTTTGQTTTTTAEAVTFVDVGIQLSVTPTINDDGYVTMKIKPEISSVTSFLTTPGGNRIPIIDSSQAETTVMVKDGVSIVIGGLRKDEKTENRQKIPFLGDIPILGAPFNSFSTTSVHTELLILITPHLVDGKTLVSGDDLKMKPGTAGPDALEAPYLSFVDYSGAELEKRSAVRTVAVPS
jgi:type II secretory pathway component GspD/PulD (secretin)